MSLQQVKIREWACINAKGVVIMTGDLPEITAFYRKHDCIAPNGLGLFVLPVKQAAQEKRFPEPMDWEEILDYYFLLADKEDYGILTPEEESWLKHMDQIVGLC